MDEPQKVIITNIKMPFFSMVGFMIKWVLASIPAMIIVGLILAGLVFGASMALSMLGLEGMFDGMIPPH